MSCHGCAETFGFLKKEYGCPKCKFSYCKKCLRFSVVDPKTSKQIQVCTKCHQSVKEPLSVINALQRLESLDDPAKPPIVVYKQQMKHPSLKDLKKGLSVEDQRILERLESLKKEDPTTGEPRSSSKRRSSGQMEEEIAERLARLKGEEYDPEKRNKPVNFRNVKPETEEDILARFTAEVQMDSKYEAGVTSDIEERLARLRGESNPPADMNRPSTSSPGTGTVSVDHEFEELTEEEQVKRIMKQLQEELELEKKTGVAVHDMDVDGDGSAQVQPTETGIQDSDEDIDVDELCGICSEKRATLLCKECDDDIFCKGCFQELHRDLGEMHAPTVIKNKK